MSDDLPEAARDRLHGGAFTSGLSVADLAACHAMGLEPIGLVQGFCAMQWGYGPARMGFGSGGGLGMGLATGLAPNVASGGYVQNYQCPHGMVSAEHRQWGQNYEQTWIEQSWHDGYAAASHRMLEEATTLGAHGVVGVVDSVASLVEVGVVEFHLLGTAVVVTGLERPASPWATSLAGQRLAKLFEAGYAPVSTIAVVSSVRVWASCMTEYFMGSGAGLWSAPADSVEIDQLVSARTRARQLVRERARSQLQGDELHGVDLRVNEREPGPGDIDIEVQLRGNRVRRARPADPLAFPRPAVSLS